MADGAEGTALAIVVTLRCRYSAPKAGVKGETR